MFLIEIEIYHFSLPFLQPLPDTSLKLFPCLPALKLLVSFLYYIVTHVQTQKIHIYLRYIYLIYTLSIIHIVLIILLYNMLCNTLYYINQHTQLLFSYLLIIDIYVFKR